MTMELELTAISSLWATLWHASDVGGIVIYLYSYKSGLACKINSILPHYIHLIDLERKNHLVSQTQIKINPGLKSMFHEIAFQSLIRIYSEKPVLGFPWFI
jgi:hypothetical protein